MADMSTEQMADAEPVEKITKSRSEADEAYFVQRSNNTYHMFSQATTDEGADISSCTPTREDQAISRMMRLVDEFFAFRTWEDAKYAHHRPDCDSRRDALNFGIKTSWEKVHPGDHLGACIALYITWANVFREPTISLTTIMANDACRAFREITRRFRDWSPIDAPPPGPSEGLRELGRTSNSFRDLYCTLKQLSCKKPAAVQRAEQEMRKEIQRSRQESPLIEAPPTTPSAPMKFESKGDAGNETKQRTGANVPDDGVGACDGGSPCSTMRLRRSPRLRSANEVGAEDGQNCAVTADAAAQGCAPSQGQKHNGRNQEPHPTKRYSLVARLPTKDWTKFLPSKRRRSPARQEECTKGGTKSCETEKKREGFSASVSTPRKCKRKSASKTTASTATSAAVPASASQSVGRTKSPSCSQQLQIIDTDGRKMTARDTTYPHPAVVSPAVCKPTPKTLEREKGAETSMEAKVLDLENEVRMSRQRIKHLDSQILRMATENLSMKHSEADSLAKATEALQQYKEWRTKAEYMAIHQRKLREMATKSAARVQELEQEIAQGKAALQIMADAKAKWETTCSAETEKRKKLEAEVQDLKGQLEEQQAKARAKWKEEHDKLLKKTATKLAHVRNENQRLMSVNEAFVSSEEQCSKVMAALQADNQRLMEENHDLRSRRADPTVEEELRASLEEYKERCRKFQTRLG